MVRCRASPLSTLVPLFVSFLAPVAAKGRTNNLICRLVVVQLHLPAPCVYNWKHLLCSVDVTGRFLFLQ